MTDGISNLKLRVFISSVQKELADERMEMKVLFTADPFLVQHTVPCFFEQYPAPLRPDKRAYLKLLEKCQIYVLIIGREYGSCSGQSATHIEYDFAQRRQLPTLVCVKGGKTFPRDKKADAFFRQVLEDGHTYSRFETLAELHSIVRRRLIEHIKETYEVSPTKLEKEVGETSAALASTFERAQIGNRTCPDLATSLVRELAGKLDPQQRQKITPAEQNNLLLQRGYLWLHAASQKNKPTAAGLLLMGKDPSTIYPQCRIQLDVYPGRTKDSEAVVAETIRANIPTAIETAVRLIQTNTRRTPRVVGLKRVELPEYPEVALREALVNALAHRSYEDPSQRVFIEVFFDRIEVTNPGLPVGHPSLKRLEKGEVRSRSRNPLVSQGLVFLDLMEERGTGIRRMRKAMIDHGLDLPHFESEEDFFTLTLPGPAENLARIKAPFSVKQGLSKSMQKELNKRQIAILELAVSAGSVTNRQVQEGFDVVKDTALRDLTTLCQLALLEKEGKGRSIRYIPKQQPSKSPDNRPIFSG
jgi:predicted HTH transcriptional regulator